MMYVGGIVISVWNCRAALSRYVPNEGGLSLEPAKNWEALEDQAITEVEGQGGAINMSGHYTCSSGLASLAQWDKA